MPIDSVWYEVMEECGYRCVLCGQKAVSVHEIIPRSHAGNWKDKDNRVPLCNMCHVKVQDRPALYADDLRAGRDRLKLIFFHRH